MGVVQSGINRVLGMAAAGAVAYKAKKEADEKAANKLIAKQEAAAKKVKQIQEAKKKQRRNFMTYLSQMPTSLGGVVGDLPKDLQKTIAKTYSKSERTTLMDRMDKERGKK